MAILFNQFTQQYLVLRNSHTFGRHPHNVQTLLEGADISQIHASIRFNQSQWEIIDHSRNGCSVDGKRITHHNWQGLVPTSQIAFGQGQQAHWQVINLDPPHTQLFCAQEQRCIVLDRLHHLLPDEHHPQASISLSAHGNWVWDDGQQRRTLEDGMMLDLAGQRWEFVCAPEIAITAELPTLPATLNVNDIRFHFTVSRDEEHVSLKIQVGQQVFDLFERVHHYCLVTLARQRQDDADKGLDADVQGWIELEKFAKMLGLDPSHVNIQIFRARHQLIETIPGAISWPNLVERKRGFVRFGALPFEVVRGGQSMSMAD